MNIDIKNGIDQSDIATIYLDGYAFRGAGADSTLGFQEFVWLRDPSRNNSFAFDDMDNIEVGLVARCKVNFKYMNIQDYMALRRIVQQRHFTANFYDVDQGKRVTRDVYCPNNQLKKLYTFNTKLLGVLDVDLELVGTNRDLTSRGSNFTIRYDANGGTGSVPNQTAEWGDQVSLRACTQFTKSGYHLDSLNTKADGSGWKYMPNKSITLFDNLTLYAIWSV